MAGRNHNLESDQASIFEHAAGSTVMVTHVLEHDPLGTIMYPWQANLWALHYRAVTAAVARLNDSADQLGGFEVRGGIRGVWDDDYLEAVYCAGVDATVGACLAVQHLCQRIETYARTTPVDGSLADRLRACTNPIEIDATVIPGYSSLAEIVRVRRAIEHPTENTAYPSGEGSWDQAPIAWMLSERCLRTMKSFLSWFESLVEAWDEWMERQPPSPGTLQLGMRGVTSRRPYKKPPAR